MEWVRRVEAQGGGLRVGSRSQQAGGGEAVIWVRYEEEGYEVAGVSDFLWSISGVMGKVGVPRTGSNKVSYERRGGGGGSLCP